jgi:hypothetical protein
MVTFNCLSPFVLLHDLCTKRRYPHAVSLCPQEHLEQVKQVFCESPVSKVRIFLTSLVLIHPSTWKGCSQSFVFLKLSEAVTILIPFTSNSHLHPLHCAKKPTNGLHRCPRGSVLGFGWPGELVAAQACLYVCARRAGEFELIKPLMEHGRKQRRRDGSHGY